MRFTPASPPNDRGPPALEPWEEDNDKARNRARTAYRPSRRQASVRGGCERVWRVSRPPAAISRAPSHLAWSSGGLINIRHNEVDYNNAVKMPCPDAGHLGHSPIGATRGPRRRSSPVAVPPLRGAWRVVDTALDALSQVARGSRCTSNNSQPFELCVLCGSGRGQAGGPMANRPLACGVNGIPERGVPVRACQLRTDRLAGAGVLCQHPRPGRSDRHPPGRGFRIEG
jgi:hypothetical protein